MYNQEQIASLNKHLDTFNKTPRAHITGEYFLQKKVSCSKWLTLKLRLNNKCMHTDLCYFDCILHSNYQLKKIAIPMTSTRLPKLSRYQAAFGDSARTHTVRPLAITCSCSGNTTHYYVITTSESLLLPQMNRSDRQRKKPWECWMRFSPLTGCGIPNVLGST